MRWIVRAFQLIAFLTLSACTDALNISSQDGTTPRIDTLDKVSVQPGESVRFAGNNFSNEMSILFETTSLTFSLESPTLGVFVLPETLPSGIFNIVFKVGDLQLASMPLLYGASKDLPVIAADKALICSDTLFANVEGETLRGERSCLGASPCKADGEVNCLSTSLFPSFDKVAKLSPAILAQIRDSVSILGVSGTLKECSATLATDCIATPSYPALKPCAADNETDCRTTNNFPSVNVSALNPWDFRKGKTVGGVEGKLNFGQNMINSSLSITTSSTKDFAKTVEDNGALIGAASTRSPSGYSLANGDNFTQLPNLDTGLGGGGVKDDGVCNGTETCVLHDRVSGLYVTPVQSPLAPVDWDSAVTGCESLNYGGFADWHLPTQKEALLLYTNNIYARRTELAIWNFYVPFWLSTTWSEHLTYGFFVVWSGGWFFTEPKAGSKYYLCVR